VKRLALAVALSLICACGEKDVDPCSGQAGTCVALQVLGTASIDSLDIVLAGSASHESTVAFPGSPSLPVAVAVLLPDAGGTFSISVLGLRAGAGVAAGSISGVVAGGGQQVQASVILSAIPPAAKLQIVSGDAQSAAVNAVLAAPFVVEAVDANGNGVPGVAIAWAGSSNIGVSAPTSITGPDGRAQVTATLGTTVGTNFVSASATGLAAVLFSATGTPGASTTALSSSEGTSFFGQDVTLTATVSGVPGGIPSGAVSFSDNGTPLPGTGPVNLVGGVGSLSASMLSAGSHSITATFSGDSNFMASPPSNAVSVAISKALTTTALAFSQTGGAGSPVTLTATVTVTAPGAGSPTGGISFFADSISINDCDPFPVSVTGTASCITTLSAGTHEFTAGYDGDANFESSPFSSISRTVE
jgi:large repetitive protein